MDGPEVSVSEIIDYCFIYDLFSDKSGKKKTSVTVFYSFSVV